MVIISLNVNQVKARIHNLGVKWQYIGVRIDRQEWKLERERTVCIYSGETFSDFLEPSRFFSLPFLGINSQCLYWMAQ